MIEFLHNNLQYLLSGISVGGQYALIAIGYTMVYGILRLINFAHGDVFMVAGLIMIYAIAGGLPMWAAIVLVIVLTVVLGVAIEKVAYKPLRSAPRMSVMISAIGVSYLLQNCALYFTGGLPRMYPVIPFLTKSVTIWGRNDQNGHHHYSDTYARARRCARTSYKVHQDGYGDACCRKGF